MVSIKRAGLSLFRNGGVIIIERSKDGKTRVLSLSYGKDSMACLGAIEKLGWPLDRIITAELWATDDIPADLPPMVEFKEKADRIIKQRYGIDVTHVCAERSFMTEKEGGCLKPHTKRYSTWKSKTSKDVWQDIGKSQNAITQQESHLYTDSPAPLERGAIQNLKLPLLTRQKVSYQDLFYKKYNQGKKMGKIRGFAQIKGNWCTSELKNRAIRNFIGIAKVRWCSI